MPSSAPTTPPSALDEATPTSTPLARAVALASAAAATGFDWPAPDPVFEAVSSELDELDEAYRDGDLAAVRHELGDLLLAACNLARHLSVDPDRALDEANARFEARFRTLEATARGEGLVLSSLTGPQLEDRWQAAKRALAERGGGA